MSQTEHTDQAGMNLKRLLAGARQGWRRFVLGLAYFYSPAGSNLDLSRRMGRELRETRDGAPDDQRK